LKENFDRFNFAIYKEKEMADFRRWMTALAVMALFVGLASAQVGTTGTNFTPFTCAVQNVTVTPNLRSEGFTEQTGDIVLVCTGGAPIPVGTQIPTVNITVFYNVPAVTSRLINNTTGVNASEALLLIDEPNNGAAGTQTGYGPNLPQLLCNSPANGAGPNGCPQWVGTATSPLNGTVSGVPVGTSAASNTPGANVFQGVVNGASVTFNGIPILPPVSTGLARVFRITNVRVNANGAGGGVAGGPGQVNASISISGATSLPISNPNPIVGYITPGLKSSVSGAATFAQCNATTGLSAVLNFSENFGTAFKTRVDGLRGGNVSNVSSTPTQNVPGGTYNSESNFVANGNNQNSTVGLSSNTVIANVSSGGVTAGLADYGTRLKAVFSNVPAGVTVYVSTTNIVTGGVQNVLVPATNNTTASSYAVLLTSETATDAGGVPAATLTNSFTATSSSNNPTSAVSYVAFTSQGNPIVAVWEVINTQPTVTETMSFSVFFGYSNVTQTFPPSGTSQVALSLAPNATNGAFSASSGGTTAINNLIPRFADTSTNSTFATIALCQTTLLFPYITTVTGFTTGIEIANTTTDPFGTTNQSGTCALNWYQGSGNPAQTVTASIPTGTIFVADASGTSYAGPGFSGYMIAVCNFQLAHGVAIVQDIGAQKILATYLALVVVQGVSKRTPPNPNPEGLHN
jgi:hypothetical protein